MVHTANVVANGQDFGPFRQTLTSESLLGMPTLNLHIKPLGARALTNALGASTEIGRAVLERFALRESLEGVPEHGDLTALDRQECLALLATRQFGRFVYVARLGVPDVAPVTYALHQGQVLFRSGIGPKLQAADRHDRVAFEVDDVDEATQTGWTVLVSGRAERLPLGHELEQAMPSAWAHGPRDHLVRIVPTRITGRRLI